MKHAIFQMKVIEADEKANFEKVAAWADEVVQLQKPDVLVLPELWTTSYAYDNLKEVADRDCARTNAFLSALAVKHNVNIVGGSVANIIDDKVYNTAPVYNRKGELVYQYHKLHLPTSMKENQYYTAGDQVPKHFVIDGVKCGFLICYDIRFPEISRPIALEGAQVMYYCAAWPEIRIEHWNLLLQARAVENQLFVVGCGRTDICEGRQLGGNSRVYDPYGRLVQQCSEDKEETGYATLDLSVVDDMRATVPVFDDRRPDAYPCV